MISFVCRRCRSPLCVPGELADKPFLCTTCRSELIVPTTSEPASEVLPPTAPAIPAASGTSWKPLVLAATVAVLLGAGVFVARALNADDEEPPRIALNESTHEEPAAPPKAEADDRTETFLKPRRPDLTPTPPKSDETSLKGVILKLESRPRQEPKPAEPSSRPVVRKGELVRISETNEEMLRQQLAGAPEVALGARAQQVFNAHAQSARDNMAFKATPNLIDATPLVTVRPDLRALPLHHGPSSQLGPAAAQTLDTLSRKLRVYLSTAVPQGPDGRRPQPNVLREAMRQEMRGRKPEWLRAEAIPTMMQMLMHEDTPLRQMLVDFLTQINDPRSTVALAQRAVFDLSPEVRKAAVTALADRKLDAARPIFLRALRYPWAPAAEHAAEALAALGDEAAVPELVGLLRKPDPAAPLSFNDRSHLVQEVVKANHVQNCLMCHPPAVAGADPVLGLDPVVQVPTTTTTARLVSQLQGTPGSHGYGGVGGSGGVSRTSGVSRSTTIVLVPAVIRGDITYLRQDFSVSQPQQGPSVAQASARFDYMVRTRPVSQKEATRIRQEVGLHDTYPQRNAVLHALKALTGQDAGGSTEAWVELYPRAEEDVEAARLSKQFLRAPALQRDQALRRLKEGKGVVYTQALALVLAGMKEGAYKDHVRTALADRLMRMTAKTLRDKFRDDDPEVRRAAVLASQRKDKKDLVPDLIELLSDADPLTGHAASAALKALTGEEHDNAVAWQQWWKGQS